MKGFLQNILPRLNQFSSGLDKVELYVGKPWVYIDEYNEITDEYEFCRDGRLIMSRNSNVNFGNWEYRKTTNRLLVQTASETTLYKSAFIDDAIMILRKNNSDDYPFILVNDIKIPNHDWKGYLENLIKKKLADLEEKKRIKIEDEKPENTPTWVVLVYLILLIFAVALLLELFKIF